MDRLDSAAPSQDSSPPTPKHTAAELKAIQEEHRNYLLESAGGGQVAKMPPPPPKKKIKLSKKNQVTDSDAESVTGNETPRNAGESAQPSRKPSDASAYSTSPESKYDSGVNTTEDENAGEKKSGARKRHVKIEDATVTESNDAANTPLTKKRKADASAIETNDNETTAPPKKRKRASPKSKDASSSTPAGKSKRQGMDENSEEMSPPPAILTPVVAAKVRQIHEHLQNVKETALDRSPDSPNLIYVTEIDLLGALTRMRVGYELGNPYAAALDDVHDIMVSRFRAPVKVLKGASHLPPGAYEAIVAGWSQVSPPWAESSAVTGAPVPVDDDPKYQKPTWVYDGPEAHWVTIDLTKAPKNEAEIQDKLRGHGLDTLRLLEIELEMNARQKQGITGKGPVQRQWEKKEQVTAPKRWEASDPQNLQERCDSVYEYAKTDEEKMKAARKSMKKHMGVCPIPPMPIV